MQHWGPGWLLLEACDPHPLLWVWQEMEMVDPAFPSFQYNGASCLPAMGLRDPP